MSSAQVIQAGSRFNSAPLRQMPFGKYRGKRFNELPRDYVEWLMGRDIDERLRTALQTAGDDRTESVASSPPVATATPPSEGFPTLVTRFLEARTQANETKQRYGELRQQLMPLLTSRGGSYVDAVSGQRLSVQEQQRWEYDATGLHGLVDGGVLTEVEFAACLITAVDKSVVAEWQTKGRVTAEQLEGLDARTVMRTIQQVQVKPPAGAR